MNKFKTILIAMMASGMVCCSACSFDTETISNIPENPNPPEDPGAKPDPCQSPCSENAVKCQDNAVWICQKDGAECFTWQIMKECTEGTVCDEATFNCTSDCSVKCDPNAMMRCEGNVLQKCAPDANGCGVWETFEQCEGICDEQTHQCQQTCVSECTVGDKKCDNQGIAACVDSDGKGCGAWGQVEPCGEGLECKDNPVECVAACTSECAAGETQVLAAQYRECIDSDGHGCMKWKTQAECKQGEFLDPESKQCKPVCGDKCEKFSIVFLPDTQEYVRPSGNGMILNEQLQWINKHYKDKDWNIKAVLHLGDMTDTNDPSAWKMNDTAYAKYIDPLDLAYLPCTGNHDYLMCESNDSAVATCNYSRGGTRVSSSGKFNNDRFKKLNWSYAKFGTFQYTGNAYLTMTVSGIKFLLMTLEFAPRKDTICWAEDIISKYPDHKVIITTHGYLSSYADTEKRNGSNKYTSGYTAGSGPDSLATGASGYELYKELAARHNNIILVACGHVSSSTFRINKGNAGNWFNEMLVDYQSENPAEGECDHAHANGGSGGGWMRILTFDPANYSIQASTITTRPKSYFKNGDVRFYCTPMPDSPNVDYAKYPDETPDAPLSVEDIEHANTTYHKFTVNYDFVTPVDYKVTDGNVGFTHRFVNDISSGNQENPAIAMSRTSRNFVAAWADEAYDNDSDSGKDTDGKGNHDIRARIMCETGCFKGKEITVNTTTAGHQHHPAAAMNPDGDFVVVWTNDQDHGVYMRKFDLTGKERLKETKVNTTGNANMAAVAMADDGSYVVTWQDGDVYMRGFDASGNETFAQVKVSGTELQSKGKRSLPAIGMDAGGDFVITWEDDADGDGYGDIRARGFKKDGSQRIEEFTVNVNLDDQQHDPSIGMSSTGDFTIAWEDDTDGNGVFRIRMRGFNKDGSERVAHDFVSAPGEDATDPSICMSDKGVTYFSWAAKSFTDSKNNKRSNVAVQSNSNDLSKESLVSPIYAGSQNQPAIACAANGRYVILWHDDLDGNDYYEIMGKGF